MLQVKYAKLLVLVGMITSAFKRAHCSLQTR
jgi:hypothetical protein